MLSIKKRDSLQRFNVLGIALVLVVLQSLGDCSSLVQKFTNVQCSVCDEKFGVFEICRLHAVKRDVNELSVKLKILKPTMLLQNLTIRLRLMKKANGYKPFLYDVTTDICDYLEKRNHPFLNIVFNAFGNSSLGALKCPLGDEVIVEHLRFPAKMLETLPLPLDEYALFMTVSGNGKKRVEIKIYFILSNFKA